jgi:hypothetical protein
MITNRRAVDPRPLTDSGALELTPAEIRHVLFEVSRGQLDEQLARPAIRALNRIMRDASRLPLTRPNERRNLR